MSAAFTWNDGEVREALELGPDAATAELEFSGVATDTRTLVDGALFVALKGDRFDAHRFLDQAADRGARAAVVSDTPPTDGGLPLYRVADTLLALGALARHRRRRLAWRVVGITGSLGKTTVKDLLAAALAPGLRVHATRDNLNNRIGVPLTLLEAPEDAEAVVLELGTNEPGEIRMLTWIAEPDGALVVNVSEAHLERLGSLEGVLEEKLALLEGTRPEGPTLVGDEPPALPERARTLRPGVRVVGFSARADEELRGVLLGPDPRGCYAFRFKDREVRGSIPGRHGAMNLLLALAMAHLMGADLDGAIPAAEAVTPPKLRGEILELGHLSLILDCYNANPQSTIAALELLAELPRPGEKVAVLGSMLELGEGAAAFHRSVLERAGELPLCAVVATGAFASAARELGMGAGDGAEEGPLVLAVDSPEEGYDRLRPYLTGTETVLLKASRGVALERLVERFRTDFDGASGGEGEA
jgi:UDP-N-acetylmuramoyl-tripeptide--D-alanyl-D-alanine ligase